MRIRSGLMLAVVQRHVKVFGVFAPRDTGDVLAEHTPLGEASKKRSNFPSQDVTMVKRRHANCFSVSWYFCCSAYSERLSDF